MPAGWLSIAVVLVTLILAPAASAQEQDCHPLTSLDVVVRPHVPDDECHPRLSSVLRLHVAAHAWQLFIALNWPAARGARGMPDGEDPQKIADRTAPRVWETWKSLQETFIPGGKEPAGWDVPETHALCRNTGDLEPSPSKVLADLNQSGVEGEAVGPLIAQNRTYVRYEIRMNRVGFEEITRKQLYLRDKLPAENGQEKLRLPNGTINVKAAWREVRAGENTDRYYQTEALAFDPSTGQCDKRSFVLIGMHIVQKTPRRPQWIWATFEHVDNIAVGPDAPPGTTPSLNNPLLQQVRGDPPAPVDRENPPMPNPSPVQVVVSNDGLPRDFIEGVTNTKWQGSSQLNGTVWRFYKLIRTQWPVAPQVDELGGPEPLTHAANSTMETYRQRMTCMACHHNTQRTDFTWFINLRAHPLSQDVRSNARNFYNTVINWLGPLIEPLSGPLTVPRSNK